MTSKHAQNLNLQTTHRGKVIFYHPGNIGMRASGSGLRPKLMLDAFLRAGYSVFEISGDSKQRKEKIKQLKKLVRSGEHYDYLYFENLSSPLTMGQTRLPVIGRIPKPVLLDICAIRWCQKAGIPVGYFYRDMHWKFPSSFGGKISAKKLFILRIFAFLELLFIKNSIRHLFVPTTEFGRILRDEYRIKSSPLPPGCNIPAESDPPGKALNGSLKLFYVGGCGPNYDPSVFFAGVAKSGADLSFTYCTREEEWATFGNRSKVPDNVSITHALPDELPDYYHQSDICVYPLPPLGYGKISHSFKISEYIGMGKPIIAFKGTSTAALIEKEDLGWTISYSSEEVARLLNHLDNNRGEVAQKTQNVQKARKNMTWDKTIELLESKLKEIN